MGGLIIFLLLTTLLAHRVWRLAYIVLKQISWHSSEFRPRQRLAYLYVCLFLVLLAMFPSC
jgi:thiosulfate reductase cytochrome b subunit